jgi:hypothetical protein
MRTKQVSICPELHRDMAIRAAMSGDSLRDVAERGIRHELRRMERLEARRQQVTTEEESPEQTPVEV